MPEGGLYKIALKYSQGTTQPIPLSLRNLKIDDRIPFKEVEYLKFPTTGAENKSDYNVSGFIRYRVRQSDGSYILTKEKLDPNSFYTFNSMTAKAIVNLIDQIGTLQAVDVDFIVVASPNVKIKLQQGSFLKAVRRELTQFIDSFNPPESFR